jgi:hypothetical protein
MSTGLQILTFVHVAISLVGIGSGFVVIYGMLAAQRLDRWTAVFLATTILTSVTGFLFPIDRFTPAHALGILSVAVPRAWHVSRALLRCFAWCLPLGGTRR